MFAFGSVSPDAVASAVNTGDFSAFPPELCKAAQRALEVFEKSGDIQKLDLILDRAAFADMLCTAEDFGCEWITDLVRFQIDCYLILAFCRMKELQMGMELFPELYVDGARLPLSFFEQLADQPLAEFFPRL